MKKIFQAIGFVSLISACGLPETESDLSKNAIPEVPSDVPMAPGTPANSAVSSVEDHTFSVSDPIAPATYGGLWTRIISADSPTAELYIVEKRVPNVGQKPDDDWQVVGALNHDGKYLDTDIGKIYEYRVGKIFRIPPQPAAADQVVTTLPCDSSKAAVNSYRVILTGQLQFLCSPTTFVSGTIVVVDAKIGLGDQILIIRAKTLEFTERGLITSFISALELNPVPNFPAVSQVAEPFNGRSAGTLKLFADTAKGTFRITGIAEDGKMGSEGARGAAGDRGTSGVMAVDDIPAQTCRQGATHGASGQDGQPGRNGRPGGRGGNSLKLSITIPKFVLAQHLIQIAPGHGGAGGFGGSGGDGGMPGPAGFESYFCKKWSGTPPVAGNPGPAGARGANGTDGINFPIELLVP